jgi:D-3-phosphoglycerate dehydrogenase
MYWKSLPEAFQYLIKSDKVVLSPHIAGWTQESNEKIARVLAEKILNL